MKIGLTFDLKSPASLATPTSANPGDVEEEFDSPETIAAIRAVLEQLGHEVEELGDGPDLVRRLATGIPPDLVFNFAEGQGVGRCREARVPALLEMLSIPYTGSDPLTLAATLDKDCAKTLARSVGVATPRSVLTKSPANLDEILDLADALTWPIIVKPAFEGSSKGVLDTSLAYDRVELQAKIVQWQTLYHQPLLLEEFIDGEELTVGMVGHAPPTILGIMRVLPIQNQGPFIYSLEVKRDWERRVRYECPAQLTQADQAAVNDSALRCWHALGCQDVARFDFRLRQGIPYFLECNPLPGLNPRTGDLVLLAGGMGVDHAALVANIVTSAIHRLRLL